MSSSNNNDRLVSSSLSSASSLMALQLFSRLFTFALNQALFRLATPAAFGAASIQFELVLSTILFLSREGIRNALLRVPEKDDNVQSKNARMNLSLLPVLLGVPLSLATSVLYTKLASNEMKSQPHFHASIALYAIAAMLELASEPLYNRAMTELQTNVRVRAEGLGITFKSIATIAILASDKLGTLSLVAFAVGQLSYSIVLLISYLQHFGVEPMFIKKSPKNTFDSQLLRLSLTMSSQSLIKHFLTEGDKLVLSSYSRLHDQGGYAIAVNYGSLIARIIFQPIEETLRLYFSRTLSSPSPSNSETQSATTLQSLLSIYTSLSLILITFGSAFAPILLPVLLPPRYISTSAPQVLSAWIWYIPFLALNGSLESFLSSASTPQMLNSQSRWMVLFSAIYICSAIAFYQWGWGDASLVYANIINLGSRILFCMRFVDRFFEDAASSDEQKVRVKWRETLPSPSLALSIAASSALLRLSAIKFEPQSVVTKLGKRAVFDIYFLTHLGLGSVLGISCLGVWWLSSGRYLKMPTRHSKVE